MNCLLSSLHLMLLLVCCWCCSHYSSSGIRSAKTVQKTSNSLSTRPSLQRTSLSITYCKLSVVDVLYAADWWKFIPLCMAHWSVHDIENKHICTPDLWPFSIEHRLANVSSIFFLNCSQREPFNKNGACFCHQNVSIEATNGMSKAFFKLNIIFRILYFPAFTALPPFYDLSVDLQFS